MNGLMLKYSLFFAFWSMCFWMGMHAQVVALDTLNGMPDSAGIGMAIYIDVCGVDAGGTVDQTYATDLQLNGDVGSVAFDVWAPATNPATPSNGCVRFRVVPQATGMLDLSVTETVGGTPLTLDLPAIPVFTYFAPSTYIAGEEFYLSGTAAAIDAQNQAADTLNDYFMDSLEMSCFTIGGGGMYDEIYGTIAWDNTNSEGTISGLVESRPSAVSAYYTANVTFSVRDMEEPYMASIYGAKAVGVSIFLPAGRGMQDDSPKPEPTLLGQSHFTENGGRFSSRNAILFEFPQEVYAGGMWLGDVESTDLAGVPGEFVLFNGDVELVRDTIPSQSTLAQQSDATTFCGTLPGCGNEGTVWVSFAGGSPVTHAMVIVGDDRVGTAFAGLGHSEHISFGGFTLGGICDATLLDPSLWQLESQQTVSGISLNWQQPMTDLEGIGIQRMRSGVWQSIGQVAPGRETFTDSSPLSQKYTSYRLFFHQKDGGMGYSEVLQVRQAQQLALGLAAPISVIDNHHTQLNLISKTTGQATITYLDMAGRVLNRHQCWVQTGNNAIVIPIPEMPRGVYVYQIQLGGEALTGKWSN